MLNKLAFRSSGTLFPLNPHPTWYGWVHFSFSCGYSPLCIHSLVLSLLSSLRFLSCSLDSMVLLSTSAFVSAILSVCKIQCKKVFLELFRKKFPTPDTTTIRSWCSPIQRQSYSKYGAAITTSQNDDHSYLVKTFVSLFDVLHLPVVQCNVCSYYAAWMLIYMHMWISLIQYSASNGNIYVWYCIWFLYK